MFRDLVEAIRFESSTRPAPLSPGEARAKAAYARAWPGEVRRERQDRETSDYARHFQHLLRQSRRLKKSRIGGEVLRTRAKKRELKKQWKASQRDQSESSQYGQSRERTSGEGTYRHGPMAMPSWKRAELRADKKRRRRMGKKAAEVGNTEFNVGKPGGNKKPKHPRKVYQFGATFYPPGSTRRQRGHSK